ncbi:MAG: GFA family protein [Rhodospirillales bacterium]|nr:GFA family protein [Rhodospirillales bacterium]
MRTGGCLCGACKYEIDGDPVVVAHCHCTDCQKLSGAGHSTGAMFAENGVCLSGPTTSYSMPAESGNEVTRIFCSKCGSPLFGKNSGMPGFMTVPLGTLDSPDDLVPQVVVFARSRRHWDIVDENLPTYQAQPGWKPKDGV